MNVRCPSCRTVFRVDPAKVPEAGVRARCAVCAATIDVRRDGAPPARDAVERGRVAAPGIAPTLAPPAPEAPPAVTPPAAPAPPSRPVAPPTAAPAPPTPAPTPPPTRAPTSPPPPPPRLSQPFLGPRPVGREAPESAAAPATPRPSAPVFRPTPGAPVIRPPVMAPPAPPAATSPAAPAPSRPAADPLASPPSAGTPTQPARAINPFLQRDPKQKARRLARALVSDMIVYQPAKRQRALASGTLKDEFDEEIQKSWEEYVEQVGEEMATTTPYWREALNEILAGGQQVF
jgi:predicted Zn finger-like uncharacterized protein